jgi:acyl carrier protein
MGLKNADAIDATKGFFDLGLDSLMAVQLRRRLSALLGETLPVTLTFKYPTIATLSEHLAQKLGGDTSAKAAAPAPAAPMPALDKVADADIQALLQAELDSLPEDLR